MQLCKENILINLYCEKKKSGCITYYGRNTNNKQLVPRQPVRGINKGISGSDKI